MKYHKGPRGVGSAAFWEARAAAHAGLQKSHLQAYELKKYKDFPVL
jgi:hypothetical protein